MKCKRARSLCLQVQQSFMLQAKPQPQATSQFNSQQDVPVDKVMITSSSSGSEEAPAQLPTMLQPTSVLIKTPATGKILLSIGDGSTRTVFLTVFRPSVAASSDLQVFSGVQGPAGAAVNQTVPPVSLTQPTQVALHISSRSVHIFRICHYFCHVYCVLNVASLFISAQVQPKPGVISSVGGVTLGKGGMKIQVLGPALSQMPAPQPPAPVQTQVKDDYLALKYFTFVHRTDFNRCLPRQLTSQTTTVKMPLSAEPSREARYVLKAFSELLFTRRAFSVCLRVFILFVNKMSHNRCVDFTDARKEASDTRLLKNCLTSVFKCFVCVSTLRCRVLEQLRKHQGSVLHPNYGAPFNSFDDTLHRLLPYHLYQGTANSSQDYQKGS